MASSSGDECATPKRKRSARVREHVDYVHESQDQYFDGYPGHTNIGRTRKGGDRRPLAAGKVSLHACIALLTWFTCTFC